ncbi:hypothetical protein M0Q50_10440 [bacterium]|jgi:hypothetical protein|nr:hypothetical protein [bacterium]
MMDIYNEIKKLREKNVFINFEHEYYADGTNCNFQIRFFEEKYTTGSYGDNHEFGESEDVFIRAIETANFMLSDPKYLKYYFFEFDKNLPHEENTNEYIKSIGIREQIRKYIYRKN